MSGHLSPIDYPARLRHLGREIAAQGFDALVVTRQGSLHYLTGAFIPWRGAAVVTAQGDAFMLYWAMDSERIRAEGWGMEVLDWGAEQPPFVPALAGILGERSLGAGRLGLDISLDGTGQLAPGMLLANEYFELRELLPEAELVNGGPLLDHIMMIKEPAEIERLRLAARAADQGFSAGVHALAEGVTENQVAGAIEEAIRGAGSIWSWAVTGGTEVGSGPRSAFRRGVTQQATQRRIKSGEFVILDLHPMLELYLADLGLPVFFGVPHPVALKLIDTWQAVVDHLLSGLAPGVAAADLARQAMDIFKDKGLGEHGLPMFGHGLGTCARQHPFINPASSDVLAPGMVCALGCHLYVPGSGGLRMEYPVLITDEGCEALCLTAAEVHMVYS